MYKKVLFPALAAAVLCAQGVFGNSIDYLNNQSSDYFRSFNRNAALDSADIVHYNPAGTVFMVNGTYVKGDIQYLDKDYGMEYQGTDYSSTEPVLMPAFFLVCKKDDRSFIISADMIAGGGTLEYKDGLPLFKLSPATADNDFRGSSVYKALTAGGAYRISEEISLSAALRGIYALKKYESRGPYAELDAEKKAFGVGAVFGIDFFPSKYLNLAAKFETPVRLEFETETKSTFGGLFPDGEKKREDLPAVAGFGVNFYPAEGLSIGSSLTLYLNKTGENETYDEKGYGNGFDWGFGADYSVNSFLLVGCGFQYAKTGGADKSDYYAYPLDSRCYAAGIKLFPYENFSVGLSSSYIKYIDEKGSVGPSMEGVFHKRIISYNVGVEYIFR